MSAKCWNCEALTVVYLSGFILDLKLEMPHEIEIADKTYYVFMADDMEFLLRKDIDVACTKNECVTYSEDGKCALNDILLKLIHMRDNRIIAIKSANKK